MKIKFSKSIVVFFTFGFFLFPFWFLNLQPFNGNFTQENDTYKNKQNFDLEIGEDLIYNVSYAFINLGQIRIQTLSKIEKNGNKRYKTIAYIDSYRGIPFVDLHEIYESEMNGSTFSYWFRSRSKNGSGTNYIIYDFDYPNNKVYLEFGQWEDGVVEKRDTLDIKKKYQDGLSLFYFARNNLYRKESVDIPAVIMEKIVNTTINFSDRVEGVEIEAVDYPIEVVEFDGRADFTGVFGFSGEFEGWFSNDEDRVPILAKMNVLIGKVRIELMKWKKKNWVPPKFQSEG